MIFKCLSNPRPIDVVIVTVPWTDSVLPLMAPAALKPIVISAGLSCLAVDLNAEVHYALQNHPMHLDLVRFFVEEYTDKTTSDWINDLHISIAEQIMKFSPKIVCLSVFSYICQASTKWIAYYIKKINPNVKIIIGGVGCLVNFTGPSDFADNLLEAGLVDYHVRGDGEHTLYELLTGNDKFPGINSNTWQQLTNEDLSHIPTPDYSDYDFSFYELQTLPIIGSRGCVRQCTFCDVIINWKKFQWRTAQDIFEEIQEQYKKYNIRSFKFQDSLTNGNLKEFRELCKLLAEFNKTLSQKIRWSGYYIFREFTEKSEEDWQLLYDSGAEILVVGIENLNEDIRYKIGKKFSNAAIDLHLEQALKYNITLQLLNIVGYIDETQEHIDFIKWWLNTHTKYKDILYLQWGGTLGIFPNTYLDDHKDDLGIKMTGNNPQSWINPTINSTPKLRANWSKDLNEYSSSLGYRVLDNIDNHYLLETLIKNG